MTFESLNNTPGNASKTSTTTLGLITQKNRATSAERPESPPAKKPAPTGQTPPTKVWHLLYLVGVGVGSRCGFCSDSDICSYYDFCSVFLPARVIRIWFNYP
ncbi:hypothetical protein MRX96_051361 [Rhipicephalus microplus]